MSALIGYCFWFLGVVAIQAQNKVVYFRSDLISLFYGGLLFLGREQYLPLVYSGCPATGQEIVRYIGGLISAFYSLCAKLTSAAGCGPILMDRHESASIFSSSKYAHFPTCWTTALKLFHFVKRNRNQLCTSVSNGNQNEHICCNICTKFKLSQLPHVAPLSLWVSKATGPSCVLIYSHNDWYPVAVATLCLTIMTFLYRYKKLQRYSSSDSSISRKVLDKPSLCLFVI